MFHIEGKGSQALFSLTTPEQRQRSQHCPGMKMENADGEIRAPKNRHQQGELPSTTAQPQHPNSKARHHQLLPHTPGNQRASCTVREVGPAPRQARVRCHNTGDKNLTSYQKWKGKKYLKRMALDKWYIERATLPALGKTTLLVW